MKIILCLLLMSMMFTRADAGSWGRPMLTVTRGEVRVVWMDEHGRRIEAPHGAEGRLAIENAEGVTAELELRHILFAKWQPEPGYLVGNTRLPPLGSYPWRLRLELRWTFQRGGPVVLEYELLAPGVPVRPTPPLPRVIS